MIPDDGYPTFAGLRPEVLDGLTVVEQNFVLVTWGALTTRRPELRERIFHAAASYADDLGVERVAELRARIDAALGDDDEGDDDEAIEAADA